MIEIRSTWFVVDGVVMPGDVLPRAAPITGKITAARAKIREAIAAKGKR